MLDTEWPKARAAFEAWLRKIISTPTASRKPSCGFAPRLLSPPAEFIQDLQRCQLIRPPCGGLQNLPASR
jgi:hypothetical protein